MKQSRVSAVAVVFVLSLLVSCKRDSESPVAPAQDNSSVGGTLRPFRGSGTGNVNVTPLV